jgi:hypothetical protein
MHAIGSREIVEDVLNHSRERVMRIISTKQMNSIIFNRFIPRAL